MYKTQPKLPQWQKASNLALKRNPFNRYRILIILVICFLVWHRYSRAVAEMDESVVDERAAMAYSEEKGPQRMEEPVTISDAVEISASHSSDQEDSMETEPGELNESEDIVNVAPVLPSDPGNADTHSPTDIQRESVAVDENSDDETSSKQPDDDKASDKPAPKGGSDTHNPPLLVKEASQKLIDQHRSPAVKSDTENETLRSWSEDPGAQRRFPAYFEYAAQSERAESLPDIIHIPFEDAVADVELRGWEDLWFSEAQLDIQKYGVLNESKIDFIYTCKTPFQNYPACDLSKVGN